MLHNYLKNENCFFNCKWYLRSLNTLEIVNIDIFLIYPFTCPRFLNWILVVWCRNMTLENQSSTTVMALTAGGNLINRRWVAWLKVYPKVVTKSFLISLDLKDFKILWRKKIQEKILEGSRILLTEIKIILSHVSPDWERKRIFERCLRGNSVLQVCAFKRANSI